VADVVGVVVVVVVVFVSPQPVNVKTIAITKAEKAILRMRSPPQRIIFISVKPRTQVL
jgi:hypothetical protein